MAFIAWSWFVWFFKVFCVILFKFLEWIYCSWNPYPRGLGLLSAEESTWAAVLQLSPPVSQSWLAVNAWRYIFKRNKMLTPSLLARRPQSWCFSFTLWTKPAWGHHSLATRHQITNNAWSSLAPLVLLTIKYWPREGSVQDAQLPVSPVISLEVSSSPSCCCILVYASLAPLN